MFGTSLIRPPSSRLAEGIVTHIGRTDVDVARARGQHAAYTDALVASQHLQVSHPTVEVEDHRRGRLGDGGSGRLVGGEHHRDVGAL